MKFRLMIKMEVYDDKYNIACQFPKSYRIFLGFAIGNDKNNFRPEVLQ